jgi:hypothetical protein
MSNLPVRKPDARGPKAPGVPTYSLEAIMAMQKALEGGIDQEEPLLTTPSCLAQKENDTARGDIPSSLITRLRKSFATVERRLRQTLRPILAFRKQSRHTSAR